MPFLLIALRNEDDQARAARYTRRFSAMAIASVSMLVLGGIGMAFFYIGSWQGVYGTTYGFMMLAKIYLLVLILGMGAGNFFAGQVMAILSPFLRYGGASAEVGKSESPVLAIILCLAMVITKIRNFQSFRLSVFPT